MTRQYYGHNKLSEKENRMSRKFLIMMRWGFLTMACLLFSALLSACDGAQRVNFEKAQVETQATGTATITKDNLGTTAAEIKISDLKAPHEISQDKKYYTLWAEDETGSFANLGNIKLKDDRSGKLWAATKFDKLRFIITAEKSSNADQPSETAILQTDMFSVE